jgi:hypothetical protein
MLKHTPWIAAALALAAFGLGAPSAEAGGKAVTCEIRANGGQLVAVAKTASAIAASYQMDLSVASAAGTSQTSQGDDVTLAAGETVLNTTSIAGGKYAAKLTLTWAGGATSCSKQG